VPWRPPVSSVDERAEHGLDHGFDGRIIDALGLRQLGRDGFEVAIACEGVRTLHKYAEDLGEQRQVFHALRKTFTEAMEAAEVPESTVQMLIGHKRASLTYGPTRYGGMRPYEAKEA
jgi:hypothetical protein